MSDHPFGTSVEVVRFHGGWAQILMGGRLGWMEMRFLGTQQEMEDARPFKGKAAVERLDDS